MLIFLIFAFRTYQKVESVVKNESSCVCAYDGFGYYMYLPHLFQNGNLKMTQEWAQNLQNKYCDGIGIYQLEKRENGNYLDIYHMGLAMVQLPSYLIGDIFAKIGGYERDGFSKPYYISYLINALLFIFLGLLYLRKLLLLFFSDITTSLSLLIIYGASNVYITFVHQYDLNHLYLFALNAVWLYHLFKFQDTGIRRNLVYSAIIFGLTVCMRPTQALWGFVPMILFFSQYKLKIEFWKKIVVYPISAFILNIPQILYWKFVGGDWLIPNRHTEDIVLADPSIIDFLFSFKKGWLLYSPIFLLIPIGFVHLYRKKKVLFYAFGGFVFMYIYIMAAWECWWYASSYGSRAMVEIYPLLTIILAYALISVKNKIHLWSIGGFVVLAIGLNAFQSQQFENWILHGSRMTKEHYGYIFGKLNIEGYTDIYLEIDRGNLNWIDRKSEYLDNGYSIKESTIFLNKGNLKTISGQDLSIWKDEIFKFIPTDESLFEVTVISKTSDSLKRAELKLEVVSKYNCYSWNTLELSKGMKNDSIVKQLYRFNLPNIRHKHDKLQVYVYNPDSVELEILQLKIKAYTLIRP